MPWLLFEILFLVGVIFFAFAQVIIPGYQGKPWFSWFREPDKKEEDQSQGE